MTQLANYYNRFDPAKNYDQVMIRDGYAVQGAEMNEIQSGFQHRVRGLGDALFRDGDILRDARISVNPETGETVCESGAVYLKGAIRGVPPSTITIPVEGVVAVGVYLQERVITELEDPSLLNPAIGSRAEGEPGAARLQVNTAWGFSPGGMGEGEFFPVYTVENGVVRAKEAPPNFDAVNQALARYDRDSAGGTYVVSGLVVLAAPDSESGNQQYTVSEGRARVNGFGVDMPTSRRLAFDARPDTLFIDSEPHTSETEDDQIVLLDRTPVAGITKVSITQEKTATITHGTYTGCSDPLPDTSVLSLIEVKQGGTTYLSGTDYRLTSGSVDWSLSGAEPAPGSTYSVKYRCIATVTPSLVDEFGCTVSGAVPGTLILVSYDQYLPRLDRLCLSQNGELVWVRGVAAAWNPRPPLVPASLLPLATVHQTWVGEASARLVVNDGVRVVPMNELAAINERIDRVVDQVAQQRLTADIHTREAGAKKGIFVDPFLNDEMRDQGTIQTAAVVDGELTLPIAVQVKPLSADVQAPAFLPFSLAVALEQPMRTGSMQVNPYLAFPPIPAVLALSPAVDRWTDFQTQWTSPMTRALSVGSGNASSTTSRTAAELASSLTRDIEHLRQIEVAYTISGFGPGEAITGFSFDGIPVTPSSVTANATGVVAGSFTIPPGVPAGVKQVEVAGSGGSRGATAFVGQGQLTIQTMRQVTTLTTTFWWASSDPLAQTFTLPEDCQLAAIDLWFTAKGATSVLVQLRETSSGFPSRSILGEARLAPSNISTTGPTRFEFAAPVSLAANVEYAFVALCDDAVSALAMAEVGKWDDWSRRWVTAQPYLVGVLLSSSNASTWTAHQDRDLTFRLLKAGFTEQARSVPLGVVSVDGVTDMMLLCLSEQPTAQARVEYRLTLPDSSRVTVSDGQVVRMATPVSGSVAVAADLRGTATASPVLFRGSQFLAGTLAGSAEYVSRAVPAGAGSTVKVVLDALLPGGSGLGVKAKGVDQGDQWTAVPYHAAMPLGDGWQELTYEGDTDEDRVQVKLELAGTTAARPRVRNLRVIVI